MSFAKYAQFYKDNGFFAGSKIKATVTDNTFIGQELVLSKGNEILRSATIPTSGKVDFFTDESGELTLSSDNGTSTLSGVVEITNYATYNITLNGSMSDNKRDIYADKEDITLNDEVTSENVNIAYTGDKSTLSAVSSNTNVAVVSINDNVVSVNDAGKGFKGTSEISVTVQATKDYQAKNISIHVEKTNGQIDKSWTGLKNIVESGREAELCEVGEEIDITLSNGKTMTYIIGAIDHDLEHQIIFVPKRYDYLDIVPFNRTSIITRYENSSLCEYLNGTFFNMLPTDMQEVISERTIEYAISDTALVSFTKKIWLPREYEILGTTNETYNKERDIYRIKQFDCFANNLVTVFTERATTYNGDNAVFLCSPTENGSSYVVDLYKKESAYFTYYKHVVSDGRAFPCFHIIKET